MAAGPADRVMYDWWNMRSLQQEWMMVLEN
jgi:hypothetical protein